MVVVDLGAVGLILAWVNDMGGCRKFPSTPIDKSNAITLDLHNEIPRRHNILFRVMSGIVD